MLRIVDSAQAMPSRPWWTYQDLAQLLNVCVRTVMRCWKGRPKFKVRNTVRIPDQEVQRFLKEWLSEDLDTVKPKMDTVKRTKRPG
jgi:hypothetical protein